jgi:hypothetical protein
MKANERCLVANVIDISYDVDAGATKTVDIYPFDAARTSFPDAEIALQVQYVPTESNGVGLHEYFVWNRKDSPTNPFFKTKWTGEFIELERNSEVVIISDDQDGGTTFRANMEDSLDTRMYPLSHFFPI